MYRQKKPSIPASEITPKQVYLSRREFIRLGGLAAAGAALAACAPALTATPPPTSAAQPQPPNPALSNAQDELGNPVTSYEEITTINNYYEFTTDKTRVAKLAENFSTSPWEVEVSGLVSKPKKYTVDELARLFPPEERIYRMRCVETWSMVIPWLGFPLARLLAAVEPTSAARYVRFETIMKRPEMVGLQQTAYPWPYQEGLRLDEAQHDLTLLATGLYGGELPAQNGGGIRLVVPWKYGFKSIKSVIKIELVAEQPATLWNKLAPQEYGFYANVNPEAPHPRWSQAYERRVGESQLRDTLLFNGYGEQVGALYSGMDLKRNY